METTVRFEFKADGTYKVTGNSLPTSGKWVVEGDKLKMTNEKGATSPGFIIAPDGSKLTVSNTRGTTTMTLVLIKA
jgi:hypothetical protein